MYATHEALIVTSEVFDYSLVTDDLISDVLMYEEDLDDSPLLQAYRIDEAIDQAILLLSRPVLSLYDVAPVILDFKLGATSW